MHSWLYRFRVIPRPGACRTTRDSLKTKTLVPFFYEGNEPLSSLFHGKFFRCSQATENLTVQIDPRGPQDSSRMKTEITFCAGLFLLAGTVSALQSQGKKREDQ